MWQHGAVLGRKEWSIAAISSTSKISPKWVRQTRKYFFKFLQATRFPPVERHGQRGKTFEYPEWLIMLIGVLAVKCNEPTYLGIHRMTCRFWHEFCGRQLRVQPISESPLRARLKIDYQLGTTPGYVFQIFPLEYSSNVISGDKTMNNALGPVWHAKQKAHGILPDGLRGVDQETMWGKSHYDGWVYGHGSFCLVSHRLCVLGAFKYMRNSAHEAKRLWLETGPLRGVIRDRDGGDGWESRR